MCIRDRGWGDHVTTDKFRNIGADGKTMHFPGFHIEAAKQLLETSTKAIAVDTLSLDFGASGFIPKRFGVETLRDAILKVMDGDVWVPRDTDLSSAGDPDMTKLRDRLVTLTPQQVRVLMMLSEGLLNKQIAYELGVSEATIKAHVSAILQKLGVESRTQAVIAAARIAGGQWRQGTPTS